MFVVKSNKFSDQKMINSLKLESDILSRIPHHENITLFLGAVIEEERSSEGLVQTCRLMMELAEREREGGREGGRECVYVCVYMYICIYTCTIKQPQEGYIYIHFIICIYIHVHVHVHVCAF